MIDEVVERFFAEAVFVWVICVVGLVETLEGGLEDGVVQDVDQRFYVDAPSCGDADLVVFADVDVERPLRIGLLKDALVSKLVDEVLLVLLFLFQGGRLFFCFGIHFKGYPRCFYWIVS